MGTYKLLKIRSFSIVVLKISDDQKRNKFVIIQGKYKGEHAFEYYVLCRYLTHYDKLFNFGKMSRFQPFIFP